MKLARQVCLKRFHRETNFITSLFLLSEQKRKKDFNDLTGGNVTLSSLGSVVTYLLLLEVVVARGLVVSNVAVGSMVVEIGPVVVPPSA